MQAKENHSPSPFWTFLKKFRKQRVALGSLFIVMGIVFAGLFAPWLVPYNPYRPVTDQYQAKGIEVSQLTNVKVPVAVWMSDGSKDTSSNTISLESEDGQIATVRKTASVATVYANGDGTTSILVSNGQIASRLKVVVSGQDDGQIYLSQLVATMPKQRLQTGESTQADVSAILTDGTQLAGMRNILAFVEQTKAVAASAPAFNNGFSNSSETPAQSNSLSFQSLTPGVVDVSQGGMITAVGEGDGAIKVSVDGISALIPVAVNQPLSQKVPVRLEPGSLLVSLMNAYKHQSPSSLHWFGTDHQNRDIFSRVLWGTRETLLIGFVSVSIGAVIGTVLGLVAGYYGRWIDGLITRFTDVLLAFPGILLAIAVIALLGPGITNIIFAVSVFTIPIFIRIVRGSTLALKEMTYVEAAKSIGVRDSVIVMRHIFPGTMSVVLVYLTMRIGTAILIGASLSFLGLGGDITAPEWGAMLSAAKDNSRNLFHPTFFPGLSIVITVLCFNLLGDGLRDALDPKLKD
ncbi:ABC transporter permease subunit [Brevibacillus ginsengisoli]|uniref:ABC transporter permease subunit n=1 Tax=Brevibacillus ginsengisoli TaxID=363854 RepID=UPI003CEAC17B